LISRMPLSTALKATNSECVRRAISRASVVLPQPGGPHRIIEPRSSRSMATRSGLPGPSDLLLSGEFFQRARAHALRQRRCDLPGSPVQIFGFEPWRRGS
jgi:hypothetical protein